MAEGATLRINRTQRAPLYTQLVQNLSGIGDVYRLYERAQYAEAGSLGRRYAEDLRLLADLSWSPFGERDDFDLRMEPVELVIALRRLGEEAKSGLLNPEEQRAAREAEAIRRSYEHTAKVCDELVEAVRAERFR